MPGDSGSHNTGESAVEESERGLDSGEEAENRRTRPNQRLLLRLWAQESQTHMTKVPIKVKSE
jgi:hypothetical protein